MLHVSITGKFAQFSTAQLCAECPAGRAHNTSGLSECPECPVNSAQVRLCV